MPTSDPSIITPVAKKILELKQRTALDIGVGYGKWGAMLREYTDIWAWRFYKNEWQTQIIGIEGFEKYRSPNWGHYDRVVIGKAEDLVPRFKVSFDLVIMMEVLEHLEKSVGLKLIRDIFSKTDKAVISFSNIPQSD